MLGLAQIEVAHTTNQQVADGKVEEAPQDIDHRGGQAYPGRGCKWALEGVPRDPVAEMGQRVREECASKKVGHVVVPARRSSLLAACPMVAQTGQKLKRG